MSQKTVEYYLGLSYPRTIVPSKAGGYFAKIEDLPGCMTQAETPKELEEMIKDAMRAWLEVALERGIRIPLPGDSKRKITPEYKVEKKPVVEKQLVTWFASAA